MHCFLNASILIAWLYAKNCIFKHTLPRTGKRIQLLAVPSHMAVLLHQASYFIPCHVFESQPHHLHLVHIDLPAPCDKMGTGIPISSNVMKFSSLTEFPNFSDQHFRLLMRKASIIFKGFLHLIHRTFS